LRIGIIGAGAVVQSYHLPVLARIPNVRIEFVCDASLERARFMATKFGIQKALSSISDCPDVDIVLVATPVGYRGTIVPTALERGWHVFCEKPFAMSAVQHREFVGIARRHRRQIGVGLMRRFYSATTTATSLVGSGMLGEVLKVWVAEGGRARSVGRSAGWYQERRATAGGGALIETGSHLIDQVFQILNVSGFELGCYEQVVLGDVEFDARAEAKLFAQGHKPVPVRVVLSKLSDVFNGVVVYFEKAEMSLGSSPSSSVSLKATGVGSRPFVVLPVGGTTNVFEAFRQEWIEFMHQCQTGDPSRVDAESALLSTEFIDACYTSAGTLATDAAGVNS
jgi:predicted dehydrogenase